jgi:hypothetical protein
MNAYVQQQSSNPNGIIPENPKDRKLNITSTPYVPRESKDNWQPKKDYTIKK